MFKFSLWKCSRTRSSNLKHRNVSFHLWYCHRFVILDRFTIDSSENAHTLHLGIQRKQETKKQLSSLKGHQLLISKLLTQSNSNICLFGNVEVGNPIEFLWDCIFMVWTNTLVMVNLKWSERRTSIKKVFVQITNIHSPNATSN